MGFSAKGRWVIAKFGRKSQSLYVTGERGDPTFELVASRSKLTGTVVIEIFLRFSTVKPYPALVGLRIEESGCTFKNFFLFGGPLTLPPFDTSVSASEFPADGITIKYLIKNEEIVLSGLQNPRPISATCYMNCVLQLLFHISVFRQMVFDIQLSEENARFERVLRALQVLYAQMSKPGVYSTEEFTKALGWTTEARAIQHDTMDFLTSFLSYLESKCSPEFQQKLKDLFYITLSVNDKETEYLNLEVDLTGCSGDVVFEDALKKYIEVDIGGKVTRLPNVLFVHLNRASELSDDKAETRCQYPDELEMENILAGAGKYRLHAVILHHGKQTRMGHYFLFSRPSRFKQWFKFHDANADVVVPGDVTLKESFGQSGKAAAVVLAYVAEQSEPFVYQCVDNSSIPDFVCDLFDEEASPEKKTKTVWIATDDDIAVACSSGFPSVQKISPKLSIEIPVEATQNEIYKLVGDALNLHPSCFSLRFASMKKQPAKLLVRRSDTKNILQTTGSSCFFYVEMNTGSAAPEGSVPIFFALFDPSTSTSTTQYLARISAGPNQPLIEFAPELKRFLGKEDLDDKDIGIFYEDKKLDISQPLYKCVKASDRVGGCFLIVQDLSSATDLDASLREGFVSYYQTLASVLGTRIHPHEFAYYYTMANSAVDAVFWRFGDDKPSFCMRLPYNDPLLTGDTLKKIVARVTGIANVNNVYHAFRPYCPNKAPIQGLFSQSFNTHVVRDYCVYFDTSEPSQGMVVRVSTSEDGISANVVHQLSLPPESTLQTAASMIGWDIENSRVLRIVDSVVHQVLPVETRVQDGCCYRIERIPEDQRGHDKFVCVSYGIIFNESLHVVKFGQPFLMPLFDEDTEDKIRERVKSMIKEVPIEAVCEFLVTKHGERIVSECLETLKANNSLVLTIIIPEFNPLSFFDPKSFFQGGIRFLN